MEIFEKELHCGAMKDFAEWCRCKASETEGEGSIHKYMTEPEFVEGNAADALLYKVSYGLSSLSDIPNPNISDIAEG